MKKIFKKIFSKIYKNTINSSVESGQAQQIKHKKEKAIRDVGKRYGRAITRLSDT